MCAVSLIFPCSFRVWAIITFHNRLSFVALSNIYLFAKPPNPHCAIRTHKIFG